MSNGKGDTRRASSVPKHVVDANYDRIFAKKEPMTDYTETLRDGKTMRVQSGSGSPAGRTGFLITLTSPSLDTPPKVLHIADCGQVTKEDTTAPRQDAEGCSTWNEDSPA